MFVESLAAILSCCGGILFIPIAVLAAEIAAAYVGRGILLAASGTRATVGILIPAHDEADGIASTIRSIAPQLMNFDRLIVVADNCTDDTGAVAASEGAEVVFRADLERRGKGFALDFGIRYLRSNPPDVVILVDADCEVKLDAIDRLAKVCANHKRPVQARYLMLNSGHARLGLRIAEFAWMVKNFVRPLGLAKLGFPCQLMGSGMAFPWAIINKLDLANAHIVEDMKTGLDLARLGLAPIFCPDAIVLSLFPTDDRGVRDQRTRWEHGHLGIILSDAPKVLVRGVTSMDFSMIAVALDLCVPPLALLVMLVAALWLAAAIFFATSGHRFPILITSCEAVIFGLSVTAAWAGYGRQIISFTSLLAAVLYPIWKIPIYTRFVFSRQREWIRSKRGRDR